MNIFILDGLKMTDRKTAHEYLAKILRLPEYYGNNLDALEECLNEFDGDSQIVILNCAKLKENLGEYGSWMLDTFRDVADQPDSFILLMKE